MSAIGTNELNLQYQQHSNSCYMNVYENKNIHIICIQLLHVLKSANAPLYLFDSIIKWAKNSVSNQNVDFITDIIPTCKQVLVDRAKMYSIQALALTSTSVILQDQVNRSTLYFIFSHNVFILCLVIKI